MFTLITVHGNNFGAWWSFYGKSFSALVMAVRYCAFVSPLLVSQHDSSSSLPHRERHFHTPKRRPGAAEICRFLCNVLKRISDHNLSLLNDSDFDLLSLLFAPEKNSIMADLWYGTHDIPPSLSSSSSTSHFYCSFPHLMGNPWPKSADTFIGWRHSQYKAQFQR